MDSQESELHSSPESLPNSFSELEKAVLEKLLAGDHPALPALRSQLSVAEVGQRTFTGSGFLTFLTIPERCPAAPLPSKARLGDVAAVVEGIENGLGFVLFIGEGKLQCLEGYTYQEDWPPSLGHWYLEYDPPGRDFSTLMP
jgi:hypothetical protein